MEYTPENITTLMPNEVFVYGSNQFARHGAGAARFAADNFGARTKVAPMGLCGQSYGIITTSFNDIRVSYPMISRQIQCLYDFAFLRPDLKFYVTKIGCGLAGLDQKIIASLFQNLLKPDNIILPKEFHV
jgi:hypothetical protein